MRSLRAFEAAARHLSFTLAANELNLTQGAISHHIRVIEELLGHKIFHREGNVVELTDVGKEYLASVRNVISEILTATNRAIDRDSDGILTIACLGTFAIKCLFPHLDDFMQLYPHIRLQVRTISPVANMASQECDVAIHYGIKSQWPDMISHQITTEYLFPVCSPKLLETGPGLRTPTDLQHHRIIQTMSPLILRNDWPLWMQGAGVSDLDLPNQITCDLLFPSYQAAIEGIGVALGRSAVVKSDLVSGRLVEPFSTRVPTHLAYHLLIPPRKAELESVRAFQDWVNDRLIKLLSE